MTQEEAGKGSKPRPFSVSHEEWMTRWDAIFARDINEGQVEVTEEEEEAFKVLESKNKLSKTV